MRALRAGAREVAQAHRSPALARNVDDNPGPFRLARRDACFLKSLQINRRDGRVIERVQRLVEDQEQRTAVDRDAPRLLSLPGREAQRHGELQRHRVAWLPESL